MNFREIYFGINKAVQEEKEKLLELGMGLNEYPWNPKNSPKLCQEAFWVASKEENNSNWVEKEDDTENGYPGVDCNEFEFTRS